MCRELSRKSRVTGRAVEPQRFASGVARRGYEAKSRVEFAGEQRGVECAEVTRESQHFEVQWTGVLPHRDWGFGR